jgi:valyl-tRNA synthetase
LEEIETQNSASKATFDSKSWDKRLEGELFDSWLKLGLQKFDVNSPKPKYVIDTPPPYPSGRFHTGSAAHYAEIDMIARTSRMLGYEVLYPIGIDRNGLPVEIYTEKKFKVSIRTTPREKFLELCRIALDDLEEEMIGIFKLMGLSGDYDNKYRTDDRAFRILTQSTFIQHWNDGRIYIGKRPSNYCVDCGTTIADAEIEYREIPTNLVYFDLPLDDGSGKIPIASTRPELLCSCQAIMVNPDDSRYSGLVGKQVRIPLYDRTVPIVAHPSAKTEFGTGAAMVCSYGDYNDAMLFKELGLKEIIAIGLDGRMTKEAGEKLAGLKVKAAREEITKTLKEIGSASKIEQINHRTPTCDRSKTPIEIIPLEEYYMKIVDIKDTLNDAAHKLKFHPETHRQILLNWIEVAHDWPISRRRVYGTEVPVWYCKSCGAPYVPEPGKYYQPWKESPPDNPTCPNCGGKEFRGDERTFDTWMDSSVSVLFVTKYLTDEMFFKQTYPAQIRPQGKEIIRTWLHYSIVRCLELTGKIPWSDVWISGWGLDERGDKMSKSRGNIIEPRPLLERYGAENFRLWAASEVSVGSDFLISEQKISGAGKFLTKLWNIARFVSRTPMPDLEPAEIFSTDRWMLAETSNLIRDCLKGYREYNFFVPANRIRDFSWNVFAAHYMELAKGRAYGEGFSEDERLSAQYTLHYVLKTILLLLAPICPFITEKIWLNLYSGESIHKQLFPEPDDRFDSFLMLGKKLMDFDSLIWNEKKSKGLSLKDPIGIGIPDDIEQFSKDLKMAHNLTA